MSIEVRVPSLPESVADATVLAWHKQPGEQVAREEHLVDLETDKVVLEVVAPADGVQGEISAAQGAVVQAGDLLGLIREGVEAGGAKAVPAPTYAPAATPSAPPPGPAARRLAKELELDTANIQGSGPEGRVTKADVLQHQEQGPREAQEEPVAAAQPESVPAPEGERPEQRVPMTRLRARIAERLIQAQQNAAILTTFNEVDMQPVMELRNRYKSQFEQRHEVKLGFMSFFVTAAVEALKRFPVVNASVDGSDIIYHGYYDIGIAVSSPRGLVVPVLRDCDRLGFAGIEQGIRDLGTKARDGSLSYDELSGGTFSITNGGIFGSMLSTPILNPPQSAILGMHAIKERPVAVDGQVVIRPVMYLALSYDHRIIDGAEAVRFLVTIKEALEDPARLLLQV